MHLKIRKQKKKQNTTRRARRRRCWRALGQVPAAAAEGEAREHAAVPRAELTAGSPPRAASPLGSAPSRRARAAPHPLSTPRMTSRFNCKLQAAARRPCTPSLHPLLLAGCRSGWRKTKGEGESNEGNGKTEGGKSGHGSRGSFCGVHPRAL